MGFIIFPNAIVIRRLPIEEDRRTIDVIIVYIFGDDEVFINQKV